MNIKAKGLTILYTFFSDLGHLLKVRNFSAMLVFCQPGRQTENPKSCLPLKSCPNGSIFYVCYV